MQKFDVVGIKKKCIGIASEVYEASLQVNCNEVLRIGDETIAKSSSSERRLKSSLRGSKTSSLSAGTSNNNSDRELSKQVLCQ